MIFSCSSSMSEGQCGIGVLRAFRTVFDTKEEAKAYNARNYSGRASGVDTKQPKSFDNQIVHYGGVGLFGTGFIDTDLMREVYTWLCANYKMVYCSPVRKNDNSGNNFFYALFDDSNNNDVAYITPPKWPFGE